MNSRAMVVFVVLVGCGIILPLASGLTPRNSQLDVTFTITTTSTMVTTLLNGENSTILLVQTLTRHNFTRGASVTADVSAGILVPTASTILTPTLSACTALLSSALLGVGGALVVFFLVGLTTLATRFVDKLGKRKTPKTQHGNNADAGILDKRLSRAIAGGLVLYVGGLFATIAYINVFAPSALWKYTLMVILPIWSVSGVLLSSPPAPIGIRAIKYTLGLATCIAASIAPLYVWYYLGQVYNIVYFDTVPLSFISSMILIMTVSTWIASRELGLLVQAEKPRDFPSILLERFAVVTSIALLPGLLLSNTDPLVSFSTLFLASMIVPVLYPIIEMERFRQVKSVLSKIGVLRTFTILGVVAFLAAYLHGPIHPIMLVGVLGSFLTSFSSSLGETESNYLRSKSMTMPWRPNIWRVLLALTPLPIWVFFLVTWWYSHLSIRVGC